MKITSRETYRIVKAMLELKRFTQYKISKEYKVTFSLVNRVVNWFVSRGYVSKRRGGYELIAAAAVFSLFPIYRKMKPIAVFEINLTEKEVLDMLRGRGALCLTSALSYYDNYFRDPAIHAYAMDSAILDEFKRAQKGYIRVEVYKEDLSKNDFVTKGGNSITGKIRTIIDLFCSNRAYAAERLIKKEWV